MEAKPLVVIVGPTASGKTAAAIRIAKRVGGEIVCADSRTIYKDMDIGTAKPSLQEQHEVPHHGIDLVAPDQRFSVADFKFYADQKINEIRARGNVPILAGGTGLYIDSVVFNFQFKDRDDTSWRANPIPSTIIVGIATPRGVLRQRIESRAEQIFANGVVDEATMLGKKYGWSTAAMTGNIYPILKDYITGSISKSDAITQFVSSDSQLAKRQMTWFRPDPFIEWCSVDEVDTYVLRRLATE